MHASIDQLLSLRDGDSTDAAVREHVQWCARCGAELARLRGITERLRRMPAVASDADRPGWAGVQQRLEREARLRGLRAAAARFAVAASVAALAVVAGVRYFDSAPGRPEARSVASSPWPAATPKPDDLQFLRNRSARLERYLAALPARPAVERADTSLSIETLEAQVQWLDHQLAVGGQEEAAAAEAERLWRDRVEVMNSLVQLRYVEAQHVVL